VGVLVLRARQAFDRGRTVDGHGHCAARPRRDGGPVDEHKVGHGHSGHGRQTRSPRRQTGVDHAVGVIDNVLYLPAGLRRSRQCSSSLSLARVVVSRATVASFRHIWEIAYATVCGTRWVISLGAAGEGYRCMHHAPGGPGRAGISANETLDKSILAGPEHFLVESAAAFPRRRHAGWPVLGWAYPVGCSWISWRPVQSALSTPRCGSTSHESTVPTRCDGKRLQAPARPAAIGAVSCCRRAGAGPRQELLENVGKTLGLVLGNERG